MKRVATWITMKTIAVTLTAFTFVIPILCSFSMLGCSETETLKACLKTHFW